MALPLRETEIQSKEKKLKSAIPACISSTSTSSISTASIKQQTVMLIKKVLHEKYHGPPTIWQKRKELVDTLQQ